MVSGSQASLVMNRSVAETYPGSRGFLREMRTVRVKHFTT